MRILITYDDGINAPGLAALAARFGKEHEVYVCAPEGQSSAASHSVLYFRKDLSVREAEIEGARQAWAADGTPADCVYLAVCGLLPELPDIVLSGINKGWNVSTDCIYSGTAGAASEGMVLGFPAMAVSLAAHGDAEYEAAAEIAEQIMYLYMEDPDRLRYYLNVNVPALKKEEIRGIRSARFDGRKLYGRRLEQYRKDGRLYFHVPLVKIPLADKGVLPDGDQSLIEQGYVCVTPLMEDWVDHEKREEWRKRLSSF